MKNTSRIIALIAIIGASGWLTAGSKPVSESEENSAAQAIDKQLDKVQSVAADAARDLSAFTHEQKKEFVAAMEAKIDELESSFDELADSIAKSSNAVKAEAKPKLANLRVKLDGLKRQLDSVKDAEESTWERVKESTGEAYDDLKSGFNDMRQWLSEKLAP